jgi:hypothetical protein
MMRCIIYASGHIREFPLFFKYMPRATKLS